MIVTAAIEIRTGGQTGVDRAAIDFAIRAGIPYTGWCPKGGWAEDYPQPPGLLSAYPRLTETPSANPKQRTAWNVRDSHATLILIRDLAEGEEPLRSSPGTEFTYSMATLVFLRPCLVLPMNSSIAVDTAKQWLAQLFAVWQTEIVIHVAGPRESEAPGIYAEAGQSLHRVFEL